MYSPPRVFIGFPGSVPYVLPELTMKVAELMRRDVQVVRDDSPVSEAVSLLADEHITGLPVVDGRHQVIGVISTTDIMEAEAESGEGLSHDTLVRDLMTPHPKTIRPDADLREAAQQMLYLDVHRLFVEENGAVVGVISQTDVVRAVATGKL